MKAWLKRIWSWLKADLSGRDEWVDEEEQEHRKEEESTPLTRDTRGQTDGFRVVG
jgi:hypothetical protein